MLAVDLLMTERVVCSDDEPERFASPLIDLAARMQVTAKGPVAI
jgi:hypothetical protein